MLKSILCFSVCLCAIALPSFADLTQQDLKEIRLIVKEEIEKVIEKEIKPMKDDIVSLKEEVARLGGRLDGIEKQIGTTTNLVYFLIALIVVAVGIPQVIVALHSRKDQMQQRQIEILMEEIEKLKQQRIVKP